MSLYLQWKNELNAVPQIMWDLATLRGIMGQIERLKFHFFGGSIWHSPSPQGTTDLGCCDYGENRG